jgi:hypothetical protein
VENCKLFGKWKCDTHCAEEAIGQDQACVDGNKANHDRATAQHNACIDSAKRVYDACLKDREKQVAELDTKNTETQALIAVLIKDDDITTEKRRMCPA